MMVVGNCGRYRNSGNVATMGESSLGERLAKARTEAGLTQGELASLVGLKQQTIGAIESGEQASTTKIGSLAHVLRVRALWLETGEGLMRFEVGVAEHPPPYLSNDELEVLRLFRKMKPDQRRGLLEFLKR